jgi:acyl CoA:acetate/3-ketoacid CoA transferase alpha subunit
MPPLSLPPPPPAKGKKEGERKREKAEMEEEAMRQGGLTCGLHMAVAHISFCVND